MVMPKKLTDLVKDPTESQLIAKVRDSANQIWLAGLGAYVMAQKEGAKMFETLVEEGEKFQERTKSTAEERLTEVRKQASGAWDKLEQVFEDRVARALHSLSVPTRGDIDELSKRISELTKATRKLSGEVEAAEEQAEKEAIEEEVKTGQRRGRKAPATVE
jgi:poly(hydroxyalkanoate) granule-associated protein